MRVLISDVCKQINWCPRQVKRGRHVTCSGLYVQREYRKHWCFGYGDTPKHGDTLNRALPKILCHSHIFKKSRLREVGAEYTPGSSRTPRHSILGGPFNIHKPFKWASQFGKPFNLVSHSIVSHSIWYCLFWHNTPSIVGNLAKLHH